MRQTSAKIGRDEPQRACDAWARLSRRGSRGRAALLVGSCARARLYWGLLGLLPLASMIVWRLLAEEKYLSRELPGYEAYRACTLSTRPAGLVRQAQRAAGSWCTT